MLTHYKRPYMFVNKRASLISDKATYSLVFMRYGQRLKTAREYAKLTQAQLAELAGITQPNVSQLENGEGDGSFYTAQFAEACGVNALWLATEKGEMVNSRHTDKRVLQAMKIMEQMPDYLKDEAVKELDHLAQLAARLKNGTSD